MTEVTEVWDSRPAVCLSLQGCGSRCRCLESANIAIDSVNWGNFLDCAARCIHGMENCIDAVRQFSHVSGLLVFTDHSPHVDPKYDTEISACLTKMILTGLPNPNFNPNPLCLFSVCVCLKYIGSALNTLQKAPFAASEDNAKASFIYQWRPHHYL